MLVLDAFVEADHPRGQPKNKGQFAKAAGGGSSSESKPPKSLSTKIERGGEKEGSEEGEKKSVAKVAPRQKQIAGIVALSGFLQKLGKMQTMPEGATSPADFIL